MRRHLGLAAATAILLVACASAPSAESPVGSVPSAAMTPVPSTALPSTSPSPGPSLPAGVTQMFDVSYEPSGIVSYDGLLWAEEHAQRNRVYAVDPETGVALTAINVTRPCDLAVAGDRIWVADLEARRLVWIDPKAREIGGEVPGLHGPCGPQFVDGTVWFAVDEGLGHLDPTSGEAIITDLGGAVFPGSGAPFWAATHDTGDLMRIDSVTAAAKLTIPHPAGTVVGTPVASGFDSVWVGGAADRVYRLDPATGDVQAEIASAKAARLLVTREGVWLTSYDDGVVERIDPETNEVVFHTALGGFGNGISEGPGGMWVTTEDPGRIYRIDPEASGGS